MGLATRASNSPEVSRSLRSRTDRSYASRTAGSWSQPNGATGEAVVDDFAAGAASVSVGAYEADPDYVPTWSITSYAICANPCASRRAFS